MPLNVTFTVTCEDVGGDCSPDTFEALRWHLEAAVLNHWPPDLEGPDAIDVAVEVGL